MSHEPENGPESDPSPFDGDRDALFPKPDLVLPRLTEDDLRKFVGDVLAGQIFVSSQIRNPSDVGMVFMPLLMGALANYDPESLKVIGVFYEYHEKSLPRSVNGYPCFMSVRMMHRLDWVRAWKALVAEEERKKRIEIPPDEPGA